MVDIFYAHRGGLLTLSAVTVYYMASDRFKNDEVNEHAVAYMSEEGLKLLNPILNDRKVNTWMREIGIRWKKSHNWIIMVQSVENLSKWDYSQLDSDGWPEKLLIEFYWMSYGEKNPEFIFDFFMRLDVKTGPLPPDFTYQPAYSKYSFSRDLATCREIMKLNEATN